MTPVDFFKWKFWKHGNRPNGHQQNLSIYLPEIPDDTIAYFTNNYNDHQDDPKHAGYIVYPNLLRDPANIHEQLKLISKEHRKFHQPTIVFILSDYEGLYKQYKNLILLRTSVKRSLLRPNEFVLPYVWEASNEPFRASVTTVRPMIGFCGLAAANRQQLISVFENDIDFESCFIKRNDFWGGKPHDPLLKAEFWQNMRNTQFALAGRGAGNFSMRFYQALSMGRIPVLVDTDIELPLKHIIDWNELIVFEKTEKACAEKVKQIHTSGQTAKRQQLCYDSYWQILSQQNFLQHLIEALD